MSAIKPHKPIIRLSETGRAFYLDDELVDLTMLWHDLQAMPVTKANIGLLHHARGIYGMLNNTHVLVMRNGVKKEQQYSHIILRRYHHLRKILYNPSTTWSDLQ